MYNYFCPKGNDSYRNEQGLSINIALNEAILDAFARLFIKNNRQKYGKSTGYHRPYRGRRP